MIKNIHFEKITFEHKDLIFKWLNEPHVMEFWDNSQAHKDDIVNFIHGRKQTYFYGTIQYWIGHLEGTPYCFILSDRLLKEQDDLTDLHLENMSTDGHTVTLDFCIGNKDFLGKEFAAPTLKKFMEFYQKDVDSKADTFFIDPGNNNPKALHVYTKAGFECVGAFKCKKAYFEFTGDETYLMVKRT